MSGPSTPQSGMGQPKQMSTRLLTMKFMQRAVAASTHKDNSQPSTPGTEPPSKKRKFENSPQSSVPNTPSQAFADATIISAALKAEAEAQANSRSRNAKDGGETEWVLNLNLPTTTPDVDAELDGESEEIWSAQGTGRQTYGSFKRKTPQVASTTSTPANDDLSSLSDSDSPLPQAETLRELSSNANKKRHGQKAYGREHDQMDFRKSAKTTSNGLCSSRKVFPNPVKNHFGKFDPNRLDRGKESNRDRKHMRRTM